MALHSDIFPIILAGGASSRLWPASNRQRPKWDLRLFSEAGQSEPKSLIESAWDRASAIAPVENCMVVCGAEQVALVSETLPQLQEENLLIEPMPRDTAGAVAFAAGAILRRLNDPGELTSSMAKMLVLPGDHVISPVARFTECSLAAAAAATALNALVTYGILPREPSTAYGYVQRGAEVSVPTLPQAPKVYRVSAFKEKPDRATAERYVASGEYYWNGGIFMWCMSTFMEELQKQLPVHAEMARKLGHTRSNPEWEECAQSYFPTLKKISIDFGIMEHAAQVATIAADFSWDDIGSWSALMPYLETQVNNSAGPATTILALDAEKNLVFAAGKRVALVGVSNLAVVVSGNDILICPLNRDQDVKKISEQAQVKA